jgi:excisionase family DNA binding protein
VDEDQIAYQMRKAARVADVGETTIKNWVREGLLPVARIGGVRLIKRADLLALLDAHRA